MGRIKKNRFSLLELKSRKKLVDRGVSVLTRKRDAMTKELGDAARRAALARNILNKKMVDAAKPLTIIHGLEPYGSLVTTAMSSERKIYFPVSVKNVWGVKIPEIESVDVSRDLFGRGSAPYYRNPAVEETAAMFEGVINAIIKSVAIETRLEKIGAALKYASRRVNSLEVKIKPVIDKSITDIENYLEESAREDRFRMKRYKSKKRN